MKITKDHIDKLNELLDAGLVLGVGVQEPGKMCVEAAVCFALGLPHSDKPPCVGVAVRDFKIVLNDSPWSSNQARANGMRRLAIAQLGSETLDQQKFCEKLAIATVNTLLSDLLDELNIAHDCRNSQTSASAEARAASAAAWAASAARAARAAAWAASAEAWAERASSAAASAASAASAAWAARAARAACAASAARAADKYLILSATIATEVLTDMGSPGCQWLHTTDTPIFAHAKKPD